MNKAHRAEAKVAPGIRMIRNTKTGVVRWRVQVMVNGRRAQSMCKTHEAAVALLTKWRKEGTPTGGDAPAAPKDDAPAQTVEDAVRAYQQDL